MKQRLSWKWIAHSVVVLLFVFTLKLYYSNAGADELRWILAPTTSLVELVSGRSFEFESHAGYISDDRSFLIAPSCAGINLLITAFLMLSVRRLWKDRRSETVGWAHIPAAALIAYLVTLAANATRISVALLTRETPAEAGSLNQGQLHRVEGIFVYFGFLLLLWLVSERIGSGNGSGLPRRSAFPLLVYYSTTLAIPLANGAYRQGSDFWEHALFVLLIPLFMVLPVVAFGAYRRWHQLMMEPNAKTVRPEGSTAN